DSELPKYNAVSPSAAVPSNLTGPHYSSYTCALENNGDKWLLLSVNSRAPNSTSLPIFTEGDIIAGAVEINLKKRETIKGITIRVLAGTTDVGQEEKRFLDLRETLWAPKVEDGKLSSTLNGKHVWPFSFTLPREVSIPEAKGERSYQLPPSFSERASPAYVDYRLVVAVKRGFLRVDQTLSTSIAYIPLSIPDPPSPLRQAAYRSGTPLVGPKEDPEGWKVYPVMSFAGTLFGARDIVLKCELAIAKPLCFAIGSPIPLIVTWTGEDSQALDLVSAPTALELQLDRLIITGPEATEGPETQTRSDRCFSETMGKAYFWSTSNESERRILHGELEVGRRLKPSCQFPRFAIKYVLKFLDIKVPGFLLASRPDQGDAFLSEEIQIASRQTPGVVPISHAPPGYEKPQLGDYNKSVGLLEKETSDFITMATNLSYVIQVRLPT
ncbi:hypothetical protein BD779DRAFT_1724469, partial [Infundibulicybe gibba]